MPRRRKPSGPNNTTDRIDVTFGMFDLSEHFRIPYMTSVLRFQQVAEYLDLVTDDPKYATQDWHVEELFQREVNKLRVINLVEHYLKSPSRPQFFNSLTIVLKPRDLPPSTAYCAPQQDADYPNNLPIGPIMVSYDDQDPIDSIPHSLTHGQLSWNRDQVYAVAIDGQHRLAAIKDLSSDFRRNSSLSVIFIVLASELGFRVQTGWDAIRSMRSVFVDLNKRAEPVSRARNLLLDDIDPRAHFVRRLFGPSLDYQPDVSSGPLGFPIGKNQEFDSRIPLVLVDWHGETRSKIEQGPYLSSVLALDWVVDKTLRARHPKRPAIPDLLLLSIDDDNYFSKIKGSLRHWTTSWSSAGIEEHWHRCNTTETPFFLDIHEIRSLADEYQETWGRPITRLLTTIGPYPELVKLRFDADTLNPQFSQWYQAYSDREAYSKTSAKIRTYYESRLDSVEAELKTTVSLPKYRDTLRAIDALKKETVFFYLVGQRALVFALKSLVESKEAVYFADTCGFSIDDYSDNLQDLYATYLADAVNGLWRRHPEFFCKGHRVDRDPSGCTDDLSDAFWAGSLVKRDQSDQIDFSDAAAIRGSAWFVLIVHLYWFIRVNDLATVDEAEVVLAAVYDESALDGMSLGSQLMLAIGSLIAEGRNDAPMDFLLRMLEDADPDIRLVSAGERIRALLEALLDD